MSEYHHWVQCVLLHCSSSIKWHNKETPRARHYAFSCGVWTRTRSLSCHSLSASGQSKHTGLVRRCGWNLIFPVRSTHRDVSARSSPGFLTLFPASQHHRGLPSESIKKGKPVSVSGPAPELLFFCPIVREITLEEEAQCLAVCAREWATCHCGGACFVVKCVVAAS